MSTRLPRLVKDHPDLGEKAPILQAMLEIRLANAPAAPLAQSQAHLSDVLADLFPKAFQQWEMQAHIHADPAQPLPPPEHRLRGFVFTEPSEMWTLHVRQDNFLLVRLKQYPGWDDFAGFASRVWMPFVEVIQPANTVHLSVRYINRLPAGHVAYHSCTPSIIGQQVEFFQRTTHRHPLDDRFWAYISHGTAPQFGPHSVMLDTIAHIHAELHPSSDEIWKLFTDLRTYKNDIFFAHHKDPNADAG